MMFLKDIRKLTFGLTAMVAMGCLPAAFFAQAEDAPLTPQEFYQGAQLTTDRVAPFYRLTLPESAYLNTAWADLRDIRVFNNAGKAVTFSLLRVDTPKIEQTNVPLRIFPMDMNVVKADKSNQGDSRDKVKLKSANGVEIELYQDEQSSVGTSYLLQMSDGTELSDGFNQILLNWAQPKSNWQANVSLYSSDDLKEWDKQADNAPLMDLTSGSERLLLNHIDINAYSASRHARYWLLVIEGNKQSVAPVIAKAEGIVISRYSKTETLELPFSAKPISDSEVEYQLARPQPLSSLSISLSERNTVVPVSVEYRSHATDDKWLPLAKTVVYQMDDNRVSEPLALDQSLVQSVRLKAINGSWGDSPPRVIGERSQVDVIFNAQGSPPYTLVWGANLASSATIDAKLLVPASELPEGGLAELPKAYVGEFIIIGGEERLNAVSPAERAGQWQTWLLWGILILGVLGLGFIMIKLAKEMMGKEK
ncbi:DUF3999 domain-containing protein [Budvicia diplopodorum]|uniref:DUF3999 domain-containing protein n=1 Tax=Budvicia diplopodorum TaxID=1119056 RepID=UPI0013597A41|nr:DUF3999 domain-containing protein [Budvicia diplopodorum]